MAYSASILADSISLQGHRLTTALCQYPRFVHAEHLRHRAFSYSVASSRALPPKALIEQVMTDPVLPVYWGKLAKGMGAKEELTGRQRAKAEARWLHARDVAVESVYSLIDFSLATGSPACDSWAKEDESTGLSKELANRILEPWMWVTVVVTGTEAAWENFFWLRCSFAAQPEMRVAAEMLELAYTTSTPRTLRNGSWHMPFVSEPVDWEEAYGMAMGLPWQEANALRNEGKISHAEHFELLNRAQELLKKVSAARCARTSYLTHLGLRSLTEDVGLYGRLLEGDGMDPPQPMHLSPLEHVATPTPEGAYMPREEAWNLSTRHMRHGVDDLQRHWNKYGNLEGWLSLRSGIPNESGVGMLATRVQP